MVDGRKSGQERGKGVGVGRKEGQSADALSRDWSCQTATCLSKPIARERSWASSIQTSIGSSTKDLKCPTFVPCPSRYAPPSHWGVRRKSFESHADSLCPTTDTLQK